MTQGKDRIREKTHTYSLHDIMKTRKELCHLKLNKQVKTVQNKKETVVVAKKHDHRQLRNALFVHSLEITKMSNAME